MLSIHIHNRTRAFVQCLIFGVVLTVGGASYGTTQGAFGWALALAGLGTLAFGVWSLVKSVGLRRELRRISRPQ
ncbi:hypothetical protein [Streptomyces cavernicola]|uniref:Uncharacterized protein n=1 Tax=Streptomyces cavernicola TaxID=3043613 RepID=A0ABT6SDG2_9ACTN|nr:hypothetical protein [Streptomyces sp. B-S-A6]MDI3406233.1 hypothetical protein [Streptomyces sp. B-S-A6]